MATINVTPFVMRNAVITLGTDDFSKAVSTATLTPSGGLVEFRGLKPDAVYALSQSVTWTLDLEYAQDWGTGATSKSLSRYLWDNQGSTVACVINVNDTVATTTETTWAFNVNISPGQIGGAVGTVATATVSLGVVGQPVPTAPAILEGTAFDAPPGMSQEEAAAFVASQAQATAEADDDLIEE